MNPAIQEFKDQLVPRIPDFFYDLGRKEYLIKQNDGGNQREWVSLAETQVARTLMLCGVRGTKNKNEDMSPATRLLCDATMNSERTVHYSGPVAGYKEGLICVGGTRILVTVSPRILKPIAGNFDTIRAVCEGLLGEAGGVQLPYFYAWLKLSYLALRAGDTRGMPAIALCGPKNCGKTFIQQHLITPILGGRIARPYPFMSGATNFNSDLFAAEHLAMGDENPSTDLRARRRFGAYLKNMVAEDYQQLHAKFCEARTMRPFWRLTISLNDEAENILTLPPMDDSIEDKLMLLGARLFQWPMRLTHPAEKQAFAKQFASEIPAFLQWLCDMPIPDHVLGQRYTVATYHCTRILNYLTEVSPEFRLVELIKMCYFDDPVDTSSLSERSRKSKDRCRDLCLSALEIERGLTSDLSPVHYEARQLLSGGGRKIAAYLSRLSVRFPDMVKQQRTSTERKWLLHNIDVLLASVNGDTHA